MFGYQHEPYKGRGFCFPKSLPKMILQPQFRKLLEHEPSFVGGAVIDLCALRLSAYLAALSTNSPECSHRIWSRNGREGCSGMLHDIITQMVYLRHSNPMLANFHGRSSTTGIAPHPTQWDVRIYPYIPLCLVQRVEQDTFTIACVCVLYFWWLFFPLLLCTFLFAGGFSTCFQSKWLTSTCWRVSASDAILSVRPGRHMYSHASFFILVNETGLFLSFLRKKGSLF